MLTFPEDLYDGFAIDEAVKAFARVAVFDLSRENGVYRVALTAASNRHSEEAIALEFQNFALGATIDRLRLGRTGSGDPRDR